MYKKKLALALALVNGTWCSTAALAADIEEITITSQRIEETIPLDLSRYGNQVEIITAEQLRLGGYVDVSQSLQMLVPGLHLRPKNGPFDYFDASLQGSRNQEILWLIDGVRITNRLYNGTTPLDTVPSHMIERIEILKGGQGIYYGTQSVGGVVNIVTKSFQQEQDGSVSANLNTNGGQGLNGYYRAGSDQFQFVAYASRDEADGYQPWRDNEIQTSAYDRERGYEVNMAGVKLGFAPTDSSLLSVHYQKTENELDFIRPYLTVQGINAREEDILTLKYDLQLNDQLGLFVKAYRHEWDTRFTEIFNRLTSGVVNGQLNVRSNKAFWGYKDDGINAMLKFTSNHGLEYIAGYDRQEFSGSDQVWRIASLEETVNAGYVQIRTTEDLLEDTMLAFGMRRNSPSNADDKTVWNFSGKHDITDTVYVQANIGTSFRLPDAEQLFLYEYYDEDEDGVPDDGWFAIGNPNLTPEESRNINFSIGGSVGILSYEVTGFKRKITDYIANYVPLVINGVEGESFINTDDEVEIDGFEVATSWQISDAWNAGVNYTETTAQLNDNGTQLVGIPESELKISLGYQNEAQPFGVNFSLNNVGDLNERQGAKRGNYTVMDLSGSYAFGGARQHLLVLRIENLTDKVYATRVDRSTSDAGGTYLYDNLGMERTLHASYTFNF